MVRHQQVTLKATPPLRPLLRLWPLMWPRGRLTRLVDEANHPKTASSIALMCIVGDVLHWTVLLTSV